MIYIKEANFDDFEEEFAFNEKLPELESGFRNFYYGVTKEEFKDRCLNYIISLSYMTEPKGDILPMTTYYLWKDNIIIGTFTVIHELNEFQKEKDGHIAYAILEEYRGNGYATKGLSLVLEEAKKYVKEDEIYMHTTKDNPASLKVMLNNGAYIAKDNGIDFYTRIKLER